MSDLVAIPIGYRKVGVAKLMQVQVAFGGLPAVEPHTSHLRSCGASQLPSRDGVTLRSLQARRTYSVQQGLSLIAPFHQA